MKLLIISMALAWVMATPSNDARHLRLVSSRPMADSTVTVIPDSIRLTFNQKTDVVVSRIQLIGMHGDVEVSPVFASQDGMTLTAAVTGPVHGGVHTVQWSTAGDDGHIVRGTFAFTVTVAGP